MTNKEQILFILGGVIFGGIGLYSNFHRSRSTMENIDFVDAIKRFETKNPTIKLDYAALCHAYQKRNIECDLKGIEKFIQR